MQALEGNDQIFALTKSTFRSIPFFEEIETEQLDQLITKIKLINFDENTVIFKQGEVAENMYILAQGKVKVEKDGEEIAELNEGDFFGEMALISAIPRNATVTTNTKCLCISLSQSNFLELVSTDPSIALKVSKAVVKRVDS